MKQKIEDFLLLPATWIDWIAAIYLVIRVLANTSISEFLLADPETITDHLYDWAERSYHWIFPLKVIVSIIAWGWLLKLIFW